jgi:hypothetical protein
MGGPFPSRRRRFHSTKSAPRHERHLCNAEWSVCFRLRHGNGRYAPALFQPSLRLRSSFAFAEPQAEANGGKRWSNFDHLYMVEQKKWEIENTTGIRHAIVCIGKMREFYDLKTNREISKAASH